VRVGVVNVPRSIGKLGEDVVVACAGICLVRLINTVRSEVLF
jgi:hypothetical protein